MLENEPGFEVVGEAEDGDVAITETLEREPDILLLDVMMPRLPGLEALRAIMEKSSRVKIILLTSTITTQQIIEALQIGARGIVLKDAAASDLSKSMRAVLSGDYWIGGERVVNLVTALNELMKQAAAVPEKKTYGLTPRELEVVTLSSRAAATKTSPSSSPSARRRSSATCRISSTRQASRPGWNSRCSPLRTSLSRWILSCPSVASNRKGSATQAGPSFAFQ
jgi:DNA-binding NarL/FixJ family response regulator